jgi:hypothetical protein
MTPGRQRAKSLQWESDLGLQHRSRPERMSLLPKNPRRRARIFTMPEIGIGYPYERWESRHLGFKADLHETPSPPERCRSYSAGGRIISYGGKVQTQRRTQSPPAQSIEPATGRKGDRKSKKSSQIHQISLHTLSGYNIDTVCSKQGYRHSSTEDVQISAQSCHLCTMLHTTPRTGKKVPVIYKLRFG